MNRITSAFSFGFALLIAGLCFNSNASADTQRHLNRLASSIEYQSNLLLRQAGHYRHTPSYRTIVNESIKLRDTARHVRVTTFCPKSFRLLEQDLRVLDGCFHNLEAIFDGAEFNAARGIGQVRGNTRHVKRILNQLEDDIDLMRIDVRALRRELFAQRRYGNRGAVDVYRQPYRGYGRGYVPPQRINPPRCGNGRYQPYGGRGVTVGRGGFSVRIGF